MLSHSTGSWQSASRGRKLCKAAILQASFMAAIRSTALSVSAFARSIGRAMRAEQSQGYAAFAAAATHNRAKLPDLPYGYADLEPIISGEIMELHHNGHHRAYVENYNKAVDRLVDAEAKGDVRGIVREQSAIRFNGGGHLNHSIFWTNLAPPKKGGGTVPIGDLARAIDKQFGSFAQMVGILTAASVAIKGSGWGWLAYDEPGKRLLITTTANQDPLTGLHPLLGIDVWEHAYYNQYKDVRLDYVENIWKVINWRDIESRYAEAIKM